VVKASSTIWVLVALAITLLVACGSTSTTATSASTSMPADQLTLPSSTSLTPTTTPTTTPITTGGSATGPTSGGAPCTVAAILPVLQEQLPRTPALQIISVEISQCQNGYARVAAVPDNSACKPGGGGSCYQNEQVFLRASAGRWTYLTNGSGISCQYESPESLGPDLQLACRALGLR
jgi:hypothetical protein